MIITTTDILLSAAAVHVRITNRWPAVIM